MRARMCKEMRVAQSTRGARYFCDPSRKSQAIAYIYIYAQVAASFLNRATPLYLVLSDLDIDDGVVMVYENQIRVLGWCTMYE